MGGRDQSQVKNKSLKSSKKLSPFRKMYQKVITMTHASKKPLHWPLEDWGTAGVSYLLLEDV